MILNLSVLSLLTRDVIWTMGVKTTLCIFLQETIFERYGRQMDL